MDHYLYLFINLGSIAIPLIAGFDKRLQFEKQWRFLFPSFFLTMLVFIPWDMIKTNLGVWGFNPRYLLGVYVGNLPIEEWLFFITVPYACIFTYHSLNHLVKKDLFGSYSNQLAVLLASLLLLVGLMNLGRLYTSITFLSTGIFLLVLALKFKPSFLGRFFLMYMVTLLPFFLVDGMLTGSFIPEEVVFYDNSQNLGVRIGTIPIEDMVYSFLLLLMSLCWYEWLQSRYKQKVSNQ